MAFTTPGTAVAGEVLTAAFWNTNVRDNTTDLRSYQNRYATYRFTGGNITLNSNQTWANLPTIGTAGDLTLNATADDIIECGISALVSNTASSAGFDVVTIVSGSALNSFGVNGAVTTWAANQGMSGWFVSANVEKTISGTATYKLVAGDISAGTVTLRVRSTNSSATTKVLFASSVNQYVWWAKNLGPVTT